MRQGVYAIKQHINKWHLSLFEKVILMNSMLLILEALTALWITSHHLESHHYLIDTLFIVAATLSTICINIILLQISFKPLFHLLKTIRAVSAGDHHARAQEESATWEIGELAHAFNSMLDRLEHTRREQTHLILQAQEKERRHIGMELHDEAGQNLTALLIHAEILQQRFQLLTADAIGKDIKQEFTHELQEFTHLTQTTLENIRVLAQQLRPSVLDDLGLQAAFRWLGEDSEQRFHMTVQLNMINTHCLESQLTPAYETALFRIAQESLTNIARHAQANTAFITLSFDNDHHTVDVSIRDDGIGFERGKRQKGSGILGMTERATSLGGDLTINSQPGQGTMVHASFPLTTKARANEDNENILIEESSYGQ